MQKKVDKLELTILSDVFATVVALLWFDDNASMQQ